MHELPFGAEVCPNCSKNVREPQHAPLLQKRYVLGGRYLIGFCTGFSTDCVVYSGFDLQNNVPVSVYEFLPKNLIVRGEGEPSVSVRAGYGAMYESCLQSFLKLWKTLMSLNRTPALPTVKEIFSANSTAYAVCEKLESISLETYLSSSEEKFNWERVKNVFRPILIALRKLNANGIVHAAVSPETILVGSDGRLHLSGFSIPQTKSDVIELRALSSSGFAPIELSDRRLHVGTYTDVYSVMAVMYKVLTGIRPQNAAERAVNDSMFIPQEYAKELDKKAIETILSALAVYPEARIKTVDGLFSLLYPERAEAVEEAKARIKKEETYPKTAVPDPKADKPPEKEKKPTLPPQKTELPESGSSITLKVILTALLVAAMVFVTAYSTLLYKYFDVPFLDKALSAMTFLPMNGETKEHTTKPPETTESTVPISKSVIVADFTQLTYRDIENSKTFNENFDIEFSFEPSREVEKNSIISQSIPAGKTVEQGTKIKIVVSSGKPYVVLKDVMGMKYEDAYSLLTKDGFVVQKVIKENDGSRTPGTVYTMSLVAGLEFEEGTTVTLSVWGE